MTVDCLGSDCLSSGGVRRRRAVWEIGQSGRVLGILGQTERNASGGGGPLPAVRRGPTEKPQVRPPPAGAKGGITGRELAPPLPTWPGGPPPPGPPPPPPPRHSSLSVRRRTRTKGAAGSCSERVTCALSYHVRKLSPGKTSPATDQPRKNHYESFVRVTRSSSPRLGHSGRRTERA